jgi:hypothetical protein
MDTTEKFLIGVASVFGLAVAYVLLALMPVTMMAERECLAAGYPEARVTFMLERYCVTLEGAVTPRVYRK